MYHGTLYSVHCTLYSVLVCTRTVLQYILLANYNCLELFPILICLDKGILHLHQNNVFPILRAATFLRSL